MRHRSRGDGNAISVAVTVGVGVKEPSSVPCNKHDAVKTHDVSYNKLSLFGLILHVYPNVAISSCSDVYQAAPVTSPTSSTPGWRRTQLTTCTATFFVQTEARKYYANHSPFFEQFQHANYHNLTYCVKSAARTNLVSESRVGDLCRSSPWRSAVTNTWGWKAHAWWFWSSLSRPRWRP